MNLRRLLEDSLKGAQAKGPKGPGSRKRNRQRAINWIKALTREFEKHFTRGSIKAFLKYNEKHKRLEALLMSSAPNPTRRGPEGQVVRAVAGWLVDI